MALRSRITVAVALAALLVGVGVFLGVRALRQSPFTCVTRTGPVQSHKAEDPMDMIGLGVDPYQCSRAVSLEQLKAYKPALRLPDAPSANASNVVHAWENDPKVGGETVYYSSGTELSYTRGFGFDYAGNLAGGYVRRIHGIRTVVWPAGTLSRYNKIVVPLQDQTVTLYSSGRLANLIAAAATLVPNRS